MRKVEPLSHPDLLLLAGLVRSVVLADKVIDGAELDALARLGDRVVEVSETLGHGYRDDPRGMGSNRFRVVFSEANRSLPDLESVRSAASELDNPESQNVIFALVSDVAHAAGVGPAEQAMLDWLQEIWQLEPVPA